MVVVDNQRIRFGVTSSGEYGYIKVGADTVTPFKNPTGTLSKTFTTNGTSVIDVSDYAAIKIINNIPSIIGDVTVVVKITAGYYIAGRTVQSGSCNITITRKNGVNSISGGGFVTSGYFGSTSQESKLSVSASIVSISVL